MDSAFIGQGLSSKSSSAVHIFGPEAEIRSTGDAVRESFADPHYDTAILWVAFATEKGVKHIEAMTNSGAIEEIRCYVGVDEKVTSKDALQQFLDSRMDVYVYRARQVTYHPKVYFFEGGNRARVITGSSNLTQHGLFSNIEASTIIDLDKGDDNDQDVLHDLRTSLADPLSGDSSKLSTELIESLESQGLIETEAEQRRNRAKSVDSGNSAGEKSDELNSFGVDVRVQSAPRLSTTSQQKGKSGTTNAPEVDDLPSREEMPPIPKVTEFKTPTDADYYGQLTSENENQVNFMRRIIRQRGEMTKGELKKEIRERTGNTISGSFIADLRVLWRTTGEVEKDGRGDSQILTWVGE